MASAAVRIDPDRPRVSLARGALLGELGAQGRLRARRTQASARDLIELLNDYATRGITPLADALGVADPVAWEQYANDAQRDQRAGEFFFYYHSHDRAVRGEHGHFHLFVALPEAQGPGANHAHLVGIGVDARGMPRRLFTTNRWVTNERWLGADATLAALERITREPAQEMTAVERWLRGLVTIFMPQIVALLRHRDRRAQVRGSRVLEDRRMHVLSECPVSLQAQVAAIDQVLS